MRAIKYRELKRMYELDGPERTVEHLREALDARPSAARGLQPPRAGRGHRRARVGPAARPAQRRRAAAGGRRRRRRDRLLEHHRPGDLLEDPRGLHAGGVRRLEAGRHDPHAAGRREDPRHRPDRATRRPRSSPACRIRSVGLRRGLHRDALDHQARLHRAGHPRGDLLRPHAPGPAAGGRGGRDPRPEQGEAADRPGDRRDEQLQVEGRRLQHLLRRRPTAARGSTSIADELVDWTDVDAAEQLLRRHPRSEHGRAGAGPGQHGAGDAGLSPRGRTASSTPPSSSTARPTSSDRTTYANPLRRNYRVLREPAGLSADHRLGPDGGRRPRSGGSSAISAGPSPTWRTGRSPSPSRRRAARPTSTRTSSSASRPASAARPR